MNLLTISSRLALGGASLLLVLAGCGSTVASTGSTAGTGGMTTSTGNGTTSSSNGSTGNGGATSSSTGTGGLPAGSCRAQADCMAGYFCGVQILPAYCGGVCDPAFQGDCTHDTDCQDAGADYICGLPCTCSHGGAQPQPHCTKGCGSDADCGPSLTCDPTHRCVAASCAGTSGCTANFTCAGGACAAKTCTKDADCSGYCVTGSCSPVIGSCNQEVP